MSVREYIGARYVPLFADPIDWDSTKTYEPLTVVYNQGNSYTSRQYVPAGIDISNDTYWARTGNYNAQIEQYRSEVATFDDRITTNEANIANEVTRATAAEKTNADAIADEVTRATAAEKTNADAIAANADAIADEVTRATAAEKTNADAIADEVTRATAAEKTNADAIAANADAIADEVTRATNAEQTNTDAIQNLGFANPLYGVCYRPGDDTWSYVASYDLSSIGTMGNLPNKLRYSDATNLFELNGILYYPQQDRKDIYATRDGETWESGYGPNYPSPLGTGYAQWAPMLFKDKDNNIKLAMARQYNSEKITNAIGSSTPNFRIDVFDCTVDSSGKINISDEYVTVLSNGTHIDPYIVYTEAYGYIMACKNENTCQIELYSGDSLTYLNLVGSLPYVGCEAPKFYIHGNYIALVTQAYSLRTHSGTAGHTVGTFYLSTHIRLNPFSYDGMSVISCPSSYRHISLIMNSEVLSKYARRHGIVPYASSIADKTFQIGITGDDIYPATLPMKTVFAVVGAKRTITIHKATCGIQSPYITYIIGYTNNQPTITTEDGKYTHVIKDGELLPIYVTADGKICFS